MKIFIFYVVWGDNYFLVTLDIFLRITHSNILLWDPNLVRHTYQEQVNRLRSYKASEIIVSQN